MPLTQPEIDALLVVINGRADLGTDNAKLAFGTPGAGNISYVGQSFDRGQGLQQDGSSNDEAMRALVTGIGDYVKDVLVGGGGSGTKSYASVTTLVASSTTASLFNAFDDGSFVTFVEGTDWKRNVADTGVVFDPLLGRFTVSAVGPYAIRGAMYLNGSGTADSTVRVLRNGVEIWVANPKVQTSVDPIGIAVDLIVQATSATDYFEVTVISPGAVATFPGTTFNVSGI